MIGKIFNQRTQAIPNCDSLNCQGKIQAGCFSCSKCYCFKCSLAHVQNNKNHRMLDASESAAEIKANSQRHLKALRTMKDFVNSSKSQFKVNEQQLCAQKFQQQIEQINFIRKETEKIIKNFFDQISLQVATIWENYLKKYSGDEGTKQIYADLQADIRRFIQIGSRKEPTEALIKQYFVKDFENQIRKIKARVSSKQLLDIPKCPQIVLDQRVLTQISELLCAKVATKNYHSIPQSENRINITRPNYLQNKVRYLPIFPIKKKYCYLFDIAQRVYQIQDFENLQGLPAYPKTLLLPNGDLHIIGGLNDDGQPTDAHLVFRSSTSQIFKLGALPSTCNPSNSLVFKNGIIYLIGGIGSQGQWTKKCFAYNLEKKQWRIICPMIANKPHQTSAVFNDDIYCFGIPEHQRINIERYSIQFDKWQEIIIENLLSNPFNFAAGFSAIQINSYQILLFGGKKFIQSPKSKKRSTDRVISPHMYTFRPQNNSFVILGPLNPCLGVQYGQLNPVIHNGKIYNAEFLVSQNQPIVRWYETMQIIEIASKGIAQSVMILHED